MINDASIKNKESPINFRFSLPLTVSQIDCSYYKNNYNL